MNTKAHGSKIFVEVKPHADWLMAMVCGSNRKCTATKLQATKTWSHFSGCVSSQEGDVTDVEAQADLQKYNDGYIEFITKELYIDEAAKLYAQHMFFFSADIIDLGKDV